jgi:transposase
MAQYAALDVSQETTAICLVDESGKVRRQAKVATCPETISRWFAENATGLVRIGMETGPLAVWLWNELDANRPIMRCRHGCFSSFARSGGI